MKRFSILSSGFLFSGLLLASLLTGCENEKPAAGSKETLTIVYAEFMHEVNSFSPVITKERDFRADHLFYGEDARASGIAEKKQLSGFLKAVRKLGKESIEAIPLVHAKSMSGGPVDSVFYQHIKTILLEGIAGQPRVDGVYLSLHGAMGVQGMHDPEGDIIEAVRELVGPAVPIAVSFDLHANVTQRRVDCADIIVGYKTNPHRDHSKTGFKSGELLIRTMRGEIEPVMVMNKMRLLKGGGINIDFLSPFRKIFRQMKKMEKDDGVLSVSFFPVHIWIDGPELGYTTLAIADGKPELAQEKADELADMAWAVRDVPQPEGNSPEEAVEIARRKGFARRLGTLVFCDVSDAVGTGTPGESTWILKTLIEKGPELTSYITMRDEEAAREAWNYNIGDQVSLTVGGKIDTVYNQPLQYSGEIIFKEETSYGKTLIIKHDGIHMVLAELPIASRYTADYKDLGLSLWKADIVVVKNLFPFRYRYILYNRKTVNVMSPGLSSTDVTSLHYEHVPRPIYPLDNLDSWRYID
ncbi:MAG: M81 family metallopeptidase [Bacteroides sp.]|nr:M81 family metallopeptidase [Bacteroides sp.]